MARRARAQSADEPHPDEAQGAIFEGSEPIETLKMPNMNEFSPGVLDSADLGPLLELAAQHQGDRQGLVHAIAATYPRIQATQNETQRLNRANNVLIGMKECGLFDLAAHRLTQLGEDLRAAAPDERASQFTVHILTNLHGLELYDVVEVIRARGDTVTDGEIRKELRSRGFVVTENESNHGKLRQWMELSGVVDEGWNFTEQRLRDLIGVTGDVLGEWRSLTRGQRALLTEASRRAPHSADGWLDLGDIKRACELQYGRTIFPEGRFRADIIDPLEAGGWVETEGKGAGRGGKAGRMRPLPKVLDIKVDLGVDSRTTIPSDLRDKLATSLETIFADLVADETYTKGIALELLALRLVRDVGLTPVAFRLRGAETGGAEVDLVADGLHLHYSRWMFQCKNTRMVALSALAKEVGLAVMLKAHVIVLVTTGRFARSVVEHANGVEQTTGFQVVLIDGRTLDRYKRGGAGVMDRELHRQAEHALTLKAPQVIGVEES